jgi:DedD protein
VNGRYDSDNDLQDLHEMEGHDREISLGTSTILGIFFVLALLCAVFFGFGYSMGRRSAQSIATVSGPEATTYDAASTSSKPAPGSPAGRAVPTSSASKGSTDAGEDTTTHVDSATPPAATKSNPARPLISRSDAPAQPTVNPAIKPVSMPRPSAAPAAPPAPVAIPGMASFVVQVAAVSHQEDADVLMNALKKRGYSVAVRQTPQDKLLHVQIGPFATKKNADAMRQRLLTDGYNAIVK